MDGDGRLDAMSFGPFDTATVHCGSDVGFRETGPELWLHGLPGGAFTWDDAMTRASLKEVCPARPSTFVLSGGALPKGPPIVRLPAGGRVACASPPGREHRRDRGRAGARVSAASRSTLRGAELPGHGLPPRPRRRDAPTRPPLEARAPLDARRTMAVHGPGRTTAAGFTPRRCPARRRPSPCRSSRWTSASARGHGPFDPCALGEAALSARREVRASPRMPRGGAAGVRRAIRARVSLSPVSLRELLGRPRSDAGSAVHS